MRKTSVPSNPGLVLTDALRLGLSAVVRISRAIITQKIAPLFIGGEGRKGIRSMWKDALRLYRRSVAQRKPDARHLQEVENNIRKNFDIILFSTSVRYGNKEEKRKRRQEDKKYQNSLKDYAGAQLKKLGATRYPFPPTREMTVENSQTVRGYPGNSHSPLYVTTHTAPELDFIDMIRAHTDQFIRLCQKHGVPVRDAHRFIDTLIERLTPFLDYVYTRGRSGRPYFVRDGTKELRSLASEVSNLYCTRNGLRPSITSLLRDPGAPSYASEESASASQVTEVESIETEQRAQGEGIDSESYEQECGTRSLFDNLIEKCDTERNPQWTQSVEALRLLLTNKTLTDRDAEHLLKQLVEESRRLGVAFHDFAASSAFVVRPFSLYQVIRYGDESLASPDGLLCASEVQLTKQAGRIDQCLFGKKQLARSDGTPGPVFYGPRMLIEIKTKSAFNLDAYATCTKSKKNPERRVIEFDIERRRMTEDEWRAVLCSTPGEYETSQLDAYEKALLEDYRSIAESDPDPPLSLHKAVLLVDTSENWALVRQCLPRLLFTAYSSVQQGSGRTVFHCELEGRRLHAALVTLPTIKQEQAVSHPEDVRPFDPFELSSLRNDKREFTLYLTVAARGSSSESASVIAGRLHGLDFIRSISRRRNIVWFDLSGEYSDKTLREKRFWLLKQTRTIRSMVMNRVTWVDLSRELLNYGNGTKQMQSVMEHVKKEIGLISNPIVVVTGGDTVWRTMAMGFSEFQTQFLTTMPPKSSIVWFDKAVPLAKSDERYGTRCVAPFYPDSPWAHYVDRIVWNLPTPPPKYGSHAPADDDVRVIAYETRNNIRTELVTVDVLYGWGERFRSDEPPLETAREMYMKGVNAPVGAVGRPRRTYSNEDVETALGLVPHLVEQAPVFGGDDLVAIVKEDVPLGTEPPSGIVSRLTFTPRQVSVGQEADGRIKKLEPLARVNHRRQYRTTLLHVEPPKWNTRPPAEGFLNPTGVRIDRISRRELRALGMSLGLLSKRLSIAVDLLELFNSLETMVANQTVDRSGTALPVLRAIARAIEEHPSSKNLWSVLKHERAQVPSALDAAQSEHLERLRTQYPDLFFFIGNDLFLLILAALNESGVENPNTHLVEQLWNYVIPWQLTRLGLEPKYNKQHNTGKSVLHRSMLLDALGRRAKALNVVLESQVHPTDVRFGQTTLMANFPLAGPEYLLRTSFQYRPSSTDMCVMVTVPPIKDGLRLREYLMDLPRDRPYWGETDVTKLNAAAGKASRYTTLSIMIAMQRGIQGLWVLNERRTEWLPVGRIEYFTRRRESVTLVRSMTVLQDSSLRPIKVEDAPTLPSDMDNMADMAKGIVAVAFRECENANCRVSIDYRTKTYSLSIVPTATLAQADKKPLILTEEKTAQVLELLRRPEIDCEPVVIGGRQFVWSRFRDITYVGNAALLTPWVERKEPFKTTDLGLPRTASDLIGAKKKAKLHIRIAHSHEVCPIHPVTKTEIESVCERHGPTVSEGMKSIEGPVDQPDSLLNESIYRHGLCWKVGIEGEGTFPPGVSRLEDIQISGPALASLLKTGALTYREGSQWVVQEFDTPDSDSLPPEFGESVHLVEAYRSIVPTANMEPTRPLSSLVKIEETWTVEVHIESGWATWSGLSNLTGKYYGGNTQDIRISHGMPVHEAKQLILNGMTRSIPKKKIRNFAKLESMIEAGLITAGYPGAVTKPEVTQKAGVLPTWINPVQVSIDAGTITLKAEELMAAHRYEEAIEAMDSAIRLLEPFDKDPVLFPSLADVLISKAELLSSGRLAWTPDPSLLLSILDRAAELVRRMDSKAVQGHSAHGRRMRWALNMQKSLSEKLGR